MKTTQLINCSFLLFFLFIFSLEIDVISPLEINSNISNFAFIQNSNATSTQPVSQKESKPPQPKPSNATQMKEYADHAKMMTEMFLKTIKDIKSVLNKIIKSVEIQKKVNITATKLYNYTKGFTAKILVNQIRTDIKLAKINKNLMVHIKNQFYSTMRILKNEVIDKENKIELLDIKISKLKMRLPMSESICSQYLSCSSCVKNSECGWCGMTQTCMEGSKQGANSGSCMFFDYGVCSGKKDCDSYTSCQGCIKDPACGWCNKPGRPSCLNVEDVNNDKCRQDFFYHIHTSLSICPHRSLNTYKSKLLKDLEEDKDDLTLNEDVKTKSIDPEELKQINKELGVFEKKKLQEISQLKILMKSLNGTLKSVHELEKDDYIFNHYFYDKDVNVEIMHNTLLKMYEVIKDFVIDYRVYKLNKRLKKNKKKKKQKVYKILSDGTVYEDNKAIKSMQKIENIQKETKISFGSIVKKENMTLTSSKTTTTTKHDKIKKKIEKKIAKKIAKKKVIENKEKKLKKSNKKTKPLNKNISRKNVSKHKSLLNKTSSEIKSLIKEYKLEKNFTNVTKKKCNLGKKNKKTEKISDDGNDNSNSFYQTLKKYLNMILHPTNTVTEKKEVPKEKRLVKTVKPSDKIKLKLCENKTDSSNSTKLKPKNMIKVKSSIKTTNTTNITFGIHNDIDEYKNENGYDSLRKYENKKGVQR